jgi:hypothetical protein
MSDGVLFVFGFVITLIVVAGAGGVPVGCHRGRQSPDQTGRPERLPIGAYVPFRTPQLVLGRT